MLAKHRLPRQSIRKFSSLSDVELKWQTKWRDSQSKDIKHLPD